MRFSLKDLFWSVSLISIGLSLVFGPHLNRFYLTGWMAVTYEVCNWALKGAVFGAGMGALFNRKLKGALIGGLAMIPIYIAMMAFLFYSLITKYH